jgi:hypothetical protein
MSGFAVSLPFEWSKPHAMIFSGIYLKAKHPIIKTFYYILNLVSLPNNVWTLIVFAPFLIIIIIIIIILLFLPLLSFLPWHMNLSMADLRNYWTEFHETWWSYRYMFLVGPTVFRCVVKGDQSHILRGSKGVEVYYRIQWES